MQKITSMTYTGISALPKDTTVAMAYVPFQLDADMYCEEYALSRGTLFPALDKPFMKGSERCGR